jgi:hypothetical protein
VSLSYPEYLFSQCIAIGVGPLHQHAITVIAGIVYTPARYHVLFYPLVVAEVT